VCSQGHEIRRREQRKGYVGFETDEDVHEVVEGTDRRT
jgi:hypothetical protein